MSVTYTSLLLAVSSAFETQDATFLVSTPAPTSRVSTKASAGAASKVQAVLVALNVTQLGPGAEHGDARTGGSLVVRLAPSKVDAHVGLDSLAALHELGHRALIRLDGTNGVRVGNISSQATPTGIQFTAALLFGHVVVTDDPASELAGRV